MRTTTITIMVTLGICSVLTGCIVPSLHPLYTEKTLVFEPTLVGTWADKEGKNPWVFQKSNDKAYDLIVTEEGNPAQFEAHLVKIGEFLFLDTCPKEPDIENYFYLFHLIPAHIFFRIWIEGDVLRLADLDPTWLEKMIAQKKVDISHERLSEGDDDSDDSDDSDCSIVLTASTKKLQEFVLKYAENVEAFPDPAELHRQK